MERKSSRVKGIWDGHMAVVIGWPGKALLQRWHWAKGRRQWERVMQLSGEWVVQAGETVQKLCGGTIAVVLGEEWGGQCGCRGVNEGDEGRRPGQTGTAVLQGTHIHTQTCLHCHTKYTSSALVSLADFCCWELIFSWLLKGAAGMSWKTYPSMNATQGTCLKLRKHLPSQASEGSWLPCTPGLLRLFWES